MYVNSVFRGETIIFKGLINNKEFSSLKLCGRFNEILDRKSLLNIFIHIGGQNRNLDECLTEILLIKLAGKMLYHKIILVSFLPQSYLIKNDHLFGYFDFIHLPNIVLLRPLFFDNYNQRLASYYYSQSTGKKIKHRIDNGIASGSFNANIYMIIENNLKLLNK